MVMFSKHCNKISIYGICLDVSFFPRLVFSAFLLEIVIKVVWDDVKDLPFIFHASSNQRVNLENISDLKKARNDTEVD